MATIEYDGCHKVYICGPMSGIKDFNEETFDHVALMLHRKGYDVFNPAANDRKNYPGVDILKSEFGDPAEPAAKGFDLRKALQQDTYFITTHAQALCVLPGWENSKGAQAEVALAKVLGIPLGTYHSFPGDDVFVEKPIGGDRTPVIEFGSGKVIAEFPNGEVRSVSSTGGEKGTKLARYDLIPVYPLRCLAEHFGRGAQKYADRNWEKGYEWSKSYAALMRHLNAFWGGEDIDEETGSSHLAAAEWHCMTLLEYTKSHPEFDDRPRAE